MVDPEAMTEEEWIESFEAATLPASSFHHADHVRMVFLYLCRYPPLEALGRFSQGLKEFAARNGKPNLYNETITWAYVFIIHERMMRAGHRQTWQEFAAENEDLLSWKDTILSRYYQPETLRSDLAKATFLFPDKF